MKSASSIRPERGPMTRQYRKVYGPYGRTPLRVVSLGETLYERWLHFDVILGRNVPCEMTDQCAHCMRQQRRVYKAYLPAVRCDTNEVCVAEISEHAVQCMTDLRMTLDKLRGVVFTLKRDKAHKNAPVWVQNVTKHPKPENLPPAFEVEPHLNRLWGWVDRNAEDLAAMKAAEKHLLDPNPTANAKMEGIPY